ncbi:general secretion pathway protein GspB [Oceanicoccus sagamiensis]|uniref:Type II secretion system protein GspB C-terminal domain-containing protein n=1 Tax=Oceanicoccus sagamiensis TaxID=716816 RepID=A0A1X9NEK1_9GAMM|nr:general secretion pathway protein GspB [Oceanicoccus sagamiensis]ARN75601.1 hypothetical protein BST96_16710 [Oceanicoccus sagamiensis]
MSYILDALKKSDQERQQNNGPGLQTVQRPHLMNKQGHTRNIVIILLLLVIMALVLAGAWSIYNKPVATVEEVALPQLAPQPQPVAVVSPPPSPSSYIVEFSELPDPVQKAIPALTFSFHVYSDNPERRTIIINKRRVREGDSVSQGLVLEAITQQGVVLQWQGQHRFTINVVENW